MRQLSLLMAAGQICLGVFVASGCFAATAGSPTGDEVSAAISRARDVATQKWRSDAQLAQVQIVGTISPHLTMQGLVMFFISPSSRDVLDISQQFNVTPEGRGYVQQHQPDLARVLGKMMWMVEPAQPNMPPFPLKYPIPNGIVSPTQVIMTVLSGCPKCGGSFAPFTAELHTYQNGGQQTSVWVVQFGTEERFVNATTGQLISNCQFPRERQNRFRVRMTCQ